MKSIDNNLDNGDLFSSIPSEKKEIVQTQSGMEKRNDIYSIYSISDTCPKSFSEAWKYGQKVPRAERPYQNLVRNRAGQEHLTPAYVVPGTAREIKKELVTRFPDDSKGIRKLTAKQAKYAFHCICGVYGK
jgi:hypothetical protein